MVAAEQGKCSSTAPAPNHFDPRGRRVYMASPVVSRPQAAGRDTDSFAARLLRRFCVEPGQRIAQGDMKHDAENALRFPLNVMPDFWDHITGDVLDFGCGNGFQAQLMAQSPKSRARSVTGYDPYIDTSEWDRWRGIARLQFAHKLHMDRQFDAVVSISAFEHFSDPAAVLSEMRWRLRPGGKLVIAWAEPWFSPWGAHMGHFCRLPYLNLLFPESAVMHVRKDYSPDGATRYEEVHRGLNRMTLRKFERIIGGSGMEIERLEYISVKGRFPFATRVPVLREVLTSSVVCILREPTA